MRKYVLFLGLTLGFQFSSLSQNAYYDAFFLDQFRSILEDVKDLGNHSFELQFEGDRDPLIITKEQVESSKVKVGSSKKFEEGVLSIKNESGRLTIVHKDKGTIRTNSLKTEDGNHIRIIPPRLILAEEEFTQLENIRKFFLNPFDSTISNLDLSTIKISLQKYEEFHKNSSSEIRESSKFFSGASTVLNLIPGVGSGGFSLSDTTQSNILDGLATYYAEQFRKAQTVTYMKAFEATAGRLGELQILFPDTYEKLKTADPTKFPDLGNEYKKIFKEDLKNAWPNLIQYIEAYPEDSIADHKLRLLKARYVSQIRSNELYRPALITTEILTRVINNQHPVEILNFIDDQYYDVSKLSENSLEAKLIKSLHGINLIQSNIRDTTKRLSSRFANVWLDLEQLKQLNTQTKLQYFFGLIYQQDTTFFNHVFPEINTRSTFEDLRKIFAKKISPIVDDLKTIQEVGKSLTTEENPEVFLAFLEANLNLYENLELTSHKDLAKFNKVAKKLLPIYNSTREGDYSNVIHYLLRTLYQFLEGNTNFHDTELQSLISKIEDYGGFMAEVINAENSSDVKEIIKKFAAPPASFILKRTHRHTLSITGQPGYFVSLERLSDDTTSATNPNFEFVSGLTLPLGFEYTFKLKRDINNTHGSLGLFVQLLDLGAILNFRTGDETSTLPDQVTIRQVFSPGVSINYGFKNSPITLGLGYQRTPELRNISTDDSVELFSNGDRIFFRLAWDIPLINILKSKKR